MQQDGCKNTQCSWPAYIVVVVLVMSEMFMIGKSSYRSSKKMEEKQELNRIANEKKNENLNRKNDKPK